MMSTRSQSPIVAVKPDRETGSNGTQEPSETAWLLGSNKSDSSSPGSTSIQSFHSAQESIDTALLVDSQRTETSTTSQTQVVVETPPIYTYNKNKCAQVFSYIFNFLCFLTGQYVYPGGDSRWLAGCCTGSVLLPLILNLSLNVFAFGYTIVVIAFCDVEENCGFYFIYIWPQLGNSSEGFNVKPPTHAQFLDWQKVVLVTATLSGALSFLFMVSVLYGRYSWFGKFFDRETGILYYINRFIAKHEPQHHIDYINENKRHVRIIHPFKNSVYNDRQILDGDNEDDPFLSSLITPKQSFYFDAFFVLNIGVFFVAVGLIVTILSRHLGSVDSTLEGLDIVGLIAHFAAQFSAIMSCFIFSKVAYAVTNHCFDFGHCLFKDVAEQSSQGDCLQKLKEADQKYCLLLRNSLKPYGTWFAVHWLLYTITSFMSIAYVADQILVERYGTEPGDEKCHGYHDLDCRLKLAYSIFFALQHCILFIYPCFRAASVTRARANMIKYISNTDFDHLDNQDKHAFLSYLEKQNASFKISIFCAELPFGFTLAIASLLIGVLGVVMKLSV